MVDVVWLEDGSCHSNGRLRKVDPDGYDNAGGKSGTHIRLHLVEKILEQEQIGSSRASAVRRPQW